MVNSFNYSTLFLLWPCWAFLKEKDPLVVPEQAMMRNRMRRRFDVNMGQLGQMIFRHAEFKAGHLDRDIRPWGTPLITIGQKPPHLINPNQSGKDSTKGCKTSPILFSPGYMTLSYISFPSLQFQFLPTWLSYLLIIHPSFGFSYGP